MSQRLRSFTRELKVALVGKYVTVPDAYLSVTEALQHAGLTQEVRVQVTRVNSEDIRPETVRDILCGFQAIVVPGGYGDRGSDGMLVAARYARENMVPFLSIGFGMQLTVVDAVRCLLGIEGANTTEVDAQTPFPVVRIPEDRVCHNDSRSATRMGSEEIALRPGKLRDLYGMDVIQERHSNRYEVDRQYIEALAAKGFRLVGSSVNGNYPEAFEMENHPFFMSVIYHPEYQSRPSKPHPLFQALLRVAKG